MPAACSQLRSRTIEAVGARRVDRSDRLAVVVRILDPVEHDEEGGYRTSARRSGTERYVRSPARAMTPPWLVPVAWRRICSAATRRIGSSAAPRPVAGTRGADRQDRWPGSPRPVARQRPAPPRSRPVPRARRRPPAAADRRRRGERSGQRSIARRGRPVLDVSPAALTSAAIAVGQVAAEPHPVVGEPLRDVAGELARATSSPRDYGTTASTRTMLARSTSAVGSAVARSPPRVAALTKTARSDPAGIAAAPQARRQQIDLVEGHDPRLVARARARRGRPAPRPAGRRSPDRTASTTSISRSARSDLLEGRAERLDQVVRQLVDEAHRVGDDDRAGPVGSVTRRLVGSSVAKSMSATKTSASARRLSSVLLPALV